MPGNGAATNTQAMWACPHCGARQPESGRCWVCHRSSTCCATCANFRPSLVSGLGYCAIDRVRAPLRGGELLGCWQAPVTELITLGVTTIANQPTPRAVDDPAPPSVDGRSAGTPRGWLAVEPDASTHPARARR